MGEHGERSVVYLDAAKIVDRVPAIVEDQAADDDQVADHNHGFFFILLENDQWELPEAFCPGRAGKRRRLFPQVGY